MAGADAKIVFGRLYFAQLQAVQSVTTMDGITKSAPMWEVLADRTGRSWGFNYRVTAVGDDFQTDNGFVPRTGYVEPQVMNRFTVYGRQGGVFERYNVFIQTRGLWRYDDFFAGRSLLENRFSLNNSVTLRGGWSIGFSPAIGTFAFDADDYANLWNASAGDPDAQPFDPSDRITTAGSGFSVSTPQYQRFSASAGASVGNDVDFLETSRVRRRDYNASVNLRPSDRLRVQATYASTSLRRRSDGSQTLSTRIPRLRLEYQIARPIFVRVVSQYESVARAALRDPRTGEILYVGAEPGSVALSEARASNALRADWLFSYRPSPGAVFFAGYGNTLAEPGALAFRDLTRTNDAFFLKASYVFGL